MADDLFDQLAGSDGPIDPGPAFREGLWRRVEAELEQPAGASPAAAASVVEPDRPVRRAESRGVGVLAWLRASRTRTVPVAAAGVAVLSLGLGAALRAGDDPDAAQTVEIVDDPSPTPSGLAQTPGPLGPPAVVDPPLSADASATPSGRTGASAGPRRVPRPPAGVVPTAVARRRPWQVLYSTLTPNSETDYDVYTAVAGSDEAPRVLIGDIAYNAAPVFSPDRRTLAWTHNVADHEVRSIWLADADGSDRRRLPLPQCPVQLECDYDFPAFDPSGRRLAFVRSTANSSCTPAERCDEVMVYDLSAGAMTAVAYGGSPDWSPRRPEIVYAGSAGPVPRSPCEATGCYDGEIRIVDVDRAGRPSRRVGDVTGFLPRFSPDGDWIAFIRTVGSLGEGAVMRRDGSDLRDLPGCQMPGWSPDGRLVCLMAAESGSDLFLLDDNDEATQQLTFTREFEGQFRLYG